MDTSQKNYAKAQSYGTQGAVYLVEKPIRFNIYDTLAFDPVNTGSFQQQYMSVAVTTQSRTNYQVPNITDATFTKASVHTGNIVAQTKQLAEKVEYNSAFAATYGGYRFFGDPLVPDGQLQNVAAINRMGAVFRSFGGMGMATCFIPNLSAAEIRSQSYQLFTLDQNNEFTEEGTIGKLSALPNVLFMETPITLSHIAGTAADDDINLTTGYTIVSATPTAPNVPGIGTPNGTTEIVLSGMTPGTTVVTGDLVQLIGGSALGQLTFLNYTNYDIFSLNPVQGRVITGGTADGAGALTITVSPAWIYDASATPDVNRNLSRAIVPGTDTLRIARSHRAGFMFYKEYMKYVSPPLPPLAPFPSQTVTTDRGISVRAYYGAVFGGATSQFVGDLYYGYGSAEEGVCRLLFPLNG